LVSALASDLASGLESDFDSDLVSDDPLAPVSAFDSLESFDSFGAASRDAEPERLSVR
jgi:hypothetical protein